MPPAEHSESYYSRLIVKVLAIINPISGAGADSRAAASRTSLLNAELERRGVRADIHVTTHAGHARALAEGAVRDRADLVIVWGGDGTANEAGAALARSSTALGLVPAGSGNGLAAALGSPRAPHAAIARILDSPARPIDAGLLGGRPFFNIAGIGADARIAARFNLRARGRRGIWPYVLISVREGLRYRSREYEVTIDGRSRRVRALLLAFANGGEYGNHARLSRTTRIDDGQLEAFVVEDRPALRRFWDARHLVRGTVARAHGVHTSPMRQARVDSEEPLEYHVDGEPGTMRGPVSIEVLPGALLVRG